VIRVNNIPADITGISGVASESRRFTAGPVACVLMACLSSQSSAEDPFKAMIDFGMLGEWAIDCSAPASLKNPHGVRSLDRNGDVTSVQSFGADYPLVQAYYLSSSAVDADTVQVTLKDPSRPDVQIFETFRREGTKILLWETHDSTGRIAIAKGRSSSNGKEIELKPVGRCSDAASDRAPLGIWYSPTTKLTITQSGANYIVRSNNPAGVINGVWAGPIVEGRIALASPFGDVVIDGTRLFFGGAELSRIKLPGW
jgi:hypothetical protein